MELYMEKDGKRLRLGYTTGSCAAAAAKAGAWMLLTGKRKETITLDTPKGIRLTLAVREITMTKNAVSCAIEKDAGDDPDVTKGTLIFATVARKDTPGVEIDGGTGIGRVTKRGLDQPVGNAAINSVPRNMIRENVEEVMRLMDYSGGLSIIISAPEGEALAKKTFNPRLGILGGISILGTTGIVEPMSEKALVETIRVELRQRRVSGKEYALLTSGNYGSDFITRELGLNMNIAVQVSNFIGDGLDICRELGFRGVLLVGHIGKLVKIAGGMLNTHSRYGDCRMEILGAYAAAAGTSAQVVREILECVTCDDAVRLLREEKTDAETLARVTEKVRSHLEHRAALVETGVLIFSKEYGILGKSSNVDALLKKIAEE